MAQRSWLYADDHGSQYNIGLYHGSDSGHVIVYCNGAIVVIDFSITSTKRYSFYVGETFFELGLSKESTEAFAYELKINEELSQPVVQQKSKENKHYNYIAFGLAILFLIVIIATMYFFINK